MVLLTAVALNWNAPLTAVMILWVNLATASLPALALGVEPASRHIMEHPPMRVNNLLDGPLARRVIFQGVFIAALALVAFVIGQNAGSYELGCTMAFGVLGFSQVLRSLNQRSATDPVWDREGALAVPDGVGGGALVQGAQHLGESQHAERHRAAQLVAARVLADHEGDQRERRDEHALKDNAAR